MAVPTTRETFKQYCLRRLGQPVIEINVDDNQVEDRIDEALKYYWDYHFDGSEKTYLKYQITANDISNTYVTIPQNIIGVINIFDINSALQSGSIFDIRYQIALNDLYQYTNESLVPYYLNMQRIRYFEEILVGRQPIRYNRHINRLYIDMDWQKVNIGDYLIVEAYQIVDPDTYTDAWGDRWLARYASALIKRQWATNLTKYNGIQLMGNITFNGQSLYTEAQSEIEQLEGEMIRSFSLPVTDFIG